MTREEKLQLNRDRQVAVREAWKREKELVQKGMGTRDWTREEQKELLENGYVKGYEGQHMISCSLDASQAANPNNIQFLSHEDHLDAHNQAGGQGYLSPTKGFYDEKTHTLRDFKEGEEPHVETARLSSAYCKSEEYLRLRAEAMSKTQDRAMEQTSSKRQGIGR